jgi:hypothetical protein
MWKESKCTVRGLGICNVGRSVTYAVWSAGLRVVSEEGTERDTAI